MSSSVAGRGTSSDVAAWVTASRPPRNAVDSGRPYGLFVEDERDAQGKLAPCATVLLTNRECPWRCVMCDLWKNTLTTSAAPGEIPDQIAYALGRLEPARTIKLYNSGSFFDRKAIPVEDYPQIAKQLRSFDRVIVESHPLLVGPECLRLRDLLGGRLEVAMGLETAHPAVLSRLNKGFTVEQFAGAAAFLREHNMDLRVFLLVHPPYMPRAESQQWVEHSLRFAFDCSATACTLIATRGGNGAMEVLAERGHFTPPRLWELEDALDYGIALSRGRVFADLWELPLARQCSACSEARVERMRTLNRNQVELPRVACPLCGGSR